MDANQLQKAPAPRKRRTRTRLIEFFGGWSCGTGRSKDGGKYVYNAEAGEGLLFRVK